MEELVNAIMAVDRRIRWVGICNAAEQVVLSVQRPGIRTLVPPGEEDMIIQPGTQLVALAQTYERFTGPTPFLQVRWQRGQAYCIAYGEHVVIVSTEQDLPEDAVWKLLRVLRPAGSQC